MFALSGSRAASGVLSRRWNEQGPITRVQKTSNQNVSFNSFWTTITWDSAVRDDVGAWNPQVSNSSLVTPSGFSWVRVNAFGEFSNVANGVHLLGIEFFSNNTHAGFAWSWQNSISDKTRFEHPETVDTGWMRVVAGEAFHLLAYQNVVNPNQPFGPITYGNPWLQAEWGN